MTTDLTSRRSLVRWIGTIAVFLGAQFASARSAKASDHSGEAQPTPGQTVPARLGADDRLEIIELMARYAWAYDTENAAALASTFTPDGSLEVFGNVLVHSPAEFPAFLDQARQLKGEHGWQHLADHHLFRDYDGQNCIVYSYYLMPESDRQGGNVTLRAMGYYVSACSRTPRGWRFVT